MGLREFFRFESIRGRLHIYTFLLVILPLFLEGAFFSLFQRGQILENESQFLVYEMQQQRNAIRAWIDERFEDARFLAMSAPLQHQNMAELVETFQNYADTHEYVEEVVYIDADGAVAATNLKKSGVYLGDRAYFKAAREGRTGLELVPVGRISGHPLCIFSVPVTLAGGRFGGALTIPIFLRSLDKWLHAAVAYTGVRVLLCDGEGRILASSAAVAAGGGPGQARIAQELLAVGEAGGIYTDPQGREMLGVTVPLGRDGWRLAGSTPVSKVLADQRRQILWLLLGALATAALLLPLGIRFAGSIERPLTALAAYARELRATGYSAACPPLISEHPPREVVELHGAFCMMAEAAGAHIAAIERLSVQDALTGLYNRRFLFSSGSTLLAGAQRAGRPCACLMVDVDHFKAVNDKHGHNVGDRVLAHLGRILATTARKSDIVARYGGEEFTVLLADADAGQASNLGERIRENLAANPCPLEEGSLPVTVSIGVAVLRNQVEYGESPLEDLLARADKALYAAKAAGRDRVMVDAG
jgi:diguanylate cyclase (GGDEF)-like protein